MVLNDVVQVGGCHLEDVGMQAFSAIGQAIRGMATADCSNPTSRVPSVPPYRSIMLA